MKKVIVLLALLLVPLTAVSSFASQLRVFVAEMNATGVQNREEMKLTLQTLLASRMNSDKISVVGSIAEADAIVSGTYVSIGKIFSIDATAKTPTGKLLTRTYVQGDTESELIPSIGKLADKLSAELIKVHPEGLSSSAAPVSTTVVAAPSGIIRGKSVVVTAPAGDFIKPQEQLAAVPGGFVSKRLDGAANLMATGATMPDGSREVFLAEEHRLVYYRQGNDMKLIAEVELGPADKIISLDTVMSVGGLSDIYVTIIRNGEAASQVWQVKGDALVRVAEKLPYFFRSASISGGVKKLYAQAMGRDEDFFGAIAEATRTGAGITLKNPLKMPRFGTIYSFNQFRDRDGKAFTTIIDPDGYLVVFDETLKELWRSNDKYGGSELYFQKEDLDNARVTGDKFRWIFLNQRIQVTSKGEILVGKNDGGWAIGNSRSYKQGAVYCLVWNGSSLEEKWHTRETQNYMPDFFFDEARNELLMLQTTQRSGISSRGASSLTIKKVE